jgi:hypothetical protein
MDVIAGRKTVGEVQGDIFVNGRPKEQRSWSRTVGYVEQVGGGLEGPAALPAPALHQALVPHQPCGSLAAQSQGLAPRQRASSRPAGRPASAGCNALRQLTHCPAPRAGGHPLARRHGGGGAVVLGAPAPAALSVRLPGAPRRCPALLPCCCAALLLCCRAVLLCCPALLPCCCAAVLCCGELGLHRLPASGSCPPGPWQRHPRRCLPPAAARAPFPSRRSLPRLTSHP